MSNKLEDMKKASAEIKRVLKLIDAPFLVEHSTPELSFRPDFMIDLENRLFFVEVTFLKLKENVDWKTLRLIEMLFETKLFYGNKSIFTLFLLDKQDWKPYCLELLENFFDKIIYSPISQATEIFTQPKTENFDLWNIERKFYISRQKVLARKRVKLEEFGFQQIPESELELTFLRKISKINLYPRRNISFRNLKNYYLERDMNLRFFFDFFVNEKIVEIKTFRKINLKILQNLLIKSRLIRYQKEEGRIFRNRPIQMILFINGDISGPEYDKERYLRMLTTAGWDVYPVNYMNDEKTLREVLYYASE